MGLLLYQLMESVIVIGAGISGIGVSMEIKRNFPDKKVTILEGRSQLGGTWDLFNYPGIRSDSSMSTLAFSRYPWPDFNLMAAGGDIKNYLHHVAEKENLLECIEYNQNVLQADFSSADNTWTVKSSSGNVYSANLLVVACGYYNYKNGFDAKFPGKENFKGQIIHPQFWPKETDVKDKTFTIIGSGATAITLAPALVREGAAKVNICQRSPSYLLVIPRRDATLSWLRHLSTSVWWCVLRLRDIVIPAVFFSACRAFPDLVKPYLINSFLKACGADNEEKDAKLRKHFTPWYKPWEQRLCMDANAAFATAIKSGKIDMHTGVVETFCEDGLLFKNRTPAFIDYTKNDGNDVKADNEEANVIKSDCVITATGLDVIPLGCIPLSVDGNRIEVNKTVTYKGIMLVDVPNLMFVLGYLNASWTLKVDLVSSFIARMIQFMHKNQYKKVTPQIHTDDNLKILNFVDFNSGYLQRSLPIMPRQGDKFPFQSHQSWFLDYLDLKWKKVNEKHLHFSK
eukprot:GDKK01042564.1.p1 GENE.GDKK01042564.1~~GDKK01042564.1.p1  ORF type:complete len:512 (+),score=101.09 GDKK01042564.1:1-1536(+)